MTHPPAGPANPPPPSGPRLVEVGDHRINAYLGNMLVATAVLDLYGWALMRRVAGKRRVRVETFARTDVRTTSGARLQARSRLIAFATTWPTGTAA